MEQKFKDWSNQWRCHTPGLISEIMENPQCWVLKKPLEIFGHMLAEVADRASELNDPILNGLMCRLTLYEIADPKSKEFDSKLKEKTINQGHKARAALNKANGKP